MARPEKEGLSYWPRDVGFLGDKKVKMIKSEFGIKGVYVLECLLDLIYSDKGYFKAWDDDDCFLMSEGVGDGCSPTFITEVVHGCVRRFFFDKGVFDLFGVLTSKGIQKRYLLGMSKRERISIVTDYWLLPKEEISPSVLLKCAFSAIYGEETGVSVEKTPVNGSVMTQSKANKSKAKQSIAKQGARAPLAAGCAEREEWSACRLAYRKQTGRVPNLTHQNELLALCQRLGEGLVLEGFARAEQRGGESWAYTKCILEDWERLGIRSVEAARMERKTGKQANRQRFPCEQANPEQVQKDLARLDRLMLEMDAKRPRIEVVMEEGEPCDD